MKLCKFCTEFMCGQFGQNEVSYYCGPTNLKLSCAVFSDSREKALKQILKIIPDQSIITSRIGRETVCFDTEYERWTWLDTRGCICGQRPCKAYIDNDCKIGFVNEVILPQCTACLNGYPKYF